MKKYINFIIISVALSAFTACNNYLDIVPEKTEDIMLLFEQRTSAYRALATCYYYLPPSDGVYSSEAMASDELTVNLLQGGIPGRDIMRGNQNINSPIMGYWNDSTWMVFRTQESMYRGVYACNTLIDNIDHVYDMDDEEKLQWKSEAIFLKAYYHFILFSKYGPIPIMDKIIPISAEVEEMRVHRSPVDDVVKYIVETIDEAMEGLTPRISVMQDFGRIDQVIAASIKARVLLYAASPLFNGNAEYYQDFKDKDGKNYFNLEYDVRKWEAAATAADQAIRLALANDVKMYHFDTLQNRSMVLSEDLRAMKNPKYAKAMMADYSYRFMFYEAWNSETIWGDSYPTLKQGTIYYSLQAASMPMQPTGNNNGAWNWVSPTYEAVEAYYSMNGLPITEDLTWPIATAFNNGMPSNANGVDSIFVSRMAVPRVHLAREPRFYSTIGFDGSYYNIWGTKWTLRCKFTETNGRKTASTKDYSATGYLLKKVCHQQSLGDAYSKLIVYPWPVIRLAELYLTYAEAMNEAYGPSQDVYDALNEVRRRAGIPDVEEVWSDPSIARTVDKHMTKSGLREIIRQERRIELAFEGQRSNDVRRWKEGEKYFNIPVKGWNVNDATPNGYYNNQRGPVEVMQRAFVTPRDYLYPIKYSELTKNSELVQNPGW